MSTRNPKQRYAAYLMSADWKLRRQQALYRAQHLCQSPTCQLAYLRSMTEEERAEEIMANLPRHGYRLEVHHLTYERLGHEHPDDLIVLCPACHADQHGLATDESRDTTSMTEALINVLVQSAAAFAKRGSDDIDA